MNYPDLNLTNQFPGITYTASVVTSGSLITNGLGNQITFLELTSSFSITSSNLSARVWSSNGIGDAGASTITLVDAALSQSGGTVTLRGGNYLNSGGQSAQIGVGGADGGLNIPGNGGTAGMSGGDSLSGDNLGASIDCLGAADGPPSAFGGNINIKAGDSITQGGSINITVGDAATPGNINLNGNTFVNGSLMATSSYALTSSYITSSNIVGTIRNNISASSITASTQIYCKGNLIVGTSAVVNGDGGSAIGPNSRAGYHAQAIGDTAEADGSWSFAAGFGASSTGEGSMAFGEDAIATGIQSVSIGAATTIGRFSVGIGGGATSHFSQSMTIALIDTVHADDTLPNQFVANFKNGYYFNGSDMNGNLSGSLFGTSSYSISSSFSTTASYAPTTGVTQILYFLSASSAMVTMSIVNGLITSITT